MNGVTGDLEAVNERLAAAKKEYEELKEAVRETAGRIEKLKEDGKKIKDDVSDNNLAMDSACASLNTRRQLLYKITRLTWDEKAMAKRLVKGYVVNPLKNSVSVFDADPSKTDAATICDFLWDYVASGISSQWDNFEKA